MSYASPETFPRVLLEHEAVVSTIAIVGLIHFVPRSRTQMYDEVADFARARLTLPASVVHYELGMNLEPAEEEGFQQRKPEAYNNMLVQQDLRENIINMLGLAYQKNALYDLHAGTGWINHDATGIEIVERKLPQEIVDENEEDKVFYGHLLKATEEERLNIGEQLFRQQFDEGVSTAETSEHDLEREDIAVNAVLRELLLGTRHFTLLWGMNHMLNFQRAFELQGYKQVNGKTISVLDI